MLADLGRVRGPVVVVVEDLQWIDASSADFLRFLLSRMIAARLVVVATVRTDGLAARARIRQLLSELGRLPSVRRLDLEPFDVAEVQEYLSWASGDQMDPDVAAAVLRRTGGNPYYVETLATADAAGKVEGEIPRALADLLTGRVDSLPDHARTVVRCAAVAGHAVPDRLLRQVVDLGDADVDEALRVAVAEGLLTPDGAGYGFTRPAAGGGLRRPAARRARPAACRACRGAGGRRVRTGLRGGAPLHRGAGPAGAADLVGPGRRRGGAAAGAGEALQHLEHALAAWPKVGGAASLAGSTHGGVAVRAARAARLAGEPSRARDWAGRAIELCDADGDGPGGIEARAELVRALVEDEVADQAVRPAEDAVRMAEDSEPGSAALAHAVLARVLLAERRTDEARPVAERALAEARAVGAAGLEVEALTTAAFLDDVAGDRAAAADRLGTALRLARSAGELTAELRAHYSLASLHYTTATSADRCRCSGQP